MHGERFQLSLFDIANYIYNRHNHLLFQFINLPVEYDASARAKKQLAELGFLTPEQKPIVRSMLSAAALTYVAGTLSAILQFLYFFLTVMGRRR